VTQPDCCFCGQIRGVPDHDLIARMLPKSEYVRRVMIESETLAAIPSLGPLTDGHSLLCPKAHARSFAALDPAVQFEYDAIKRELTRMLTELHHCDVLLFEHGMAARGDRIPCSVEHAHQHFVPLHGLSEASLVPSLPWQRCSSSLAELRTLAGGREYLLLETPDGVCRIATLGADGFESQLMRKIIASRAGDPAAWNWREEPNPEAAHATWARFVSG